MATKKVAKKSSKVGSKKAGMIIVKNETTGRVVKLPRGKPYSSLEKLCEDIGARPSDALLISF